MLGSSLDSQNFLICSSLDISWLPICRGEDAEEVETDTTLASWVSRGLNKWPCGVLRRNPGLGGGKACFTELGQEGLFLGDK